MATVIIADEFEIPAIADLEEFRRWTLSEDFPESGRIDFIDGAIEVDMSPQDMYCHGTPKGEIFSVLYQRIKQLGLGLVFSDQMRISSPEADLSAEPDILFVSFGSLQSGRLRRIPKATLEPGRYVELEGAADLIVEIVSDSSVAKDSERLPAAYFQSGLTEYWLVDARGAQLQFQIHRRGDEGFEHVEIDENGFQRSSVLSCRYRLVRGRDIEGNWAYDLQERDTTGCCSPESAG